MGITDWLVRNNGKLPDRTLDDILVDNEVIGLADATVIVAPKTKPNLNEIGSAGSAWDRLLGATEYNSTLAGHAGLLIYDKMRRSDATVRASLRLAKTPVLAGNWYVDPGDPEDPASVEQAAFIQHAMFKAMSITWDQILQEALLMLEFGYYSFEKVFEYKEWEGKTRVMWKKWAPRHPFDVEEFLYDEHGGPDAMKMLAWEEAKSVTIPIDKLLVFTNDREANNMEGISALRSAYKHWYFKENLYKIDAIQKERHGVGIPVIMLPIGWDKADKALADELGRNLRSNESAHVVLPPGWTLEFAKVEGNSVNVIESIEHHDLQIAKNVLVQFLNTGAAASKEQEIDLYTKAVRFIADVLRNVINIHAIPQLIDYNWPGVDKYPELKVRRLGEVRDLRTLSFTVRNLVGAGILQPDDPLEHYLREEMDLPRLDKGSIRETETPQAGGGGAPGEPKPSPAKPPRQGKPSASQGKSKNSGTDRSGSK